MKMKRSIGEEMDDVYQEIHKEEED